MRSSQNPADSPHLPTGWLQELRSWKRLHIRLTILYGGVTRLDVTLLSLSVFLSGVKSEISGLQRRLLATIDSLSTSMDADAIATLPAAGKPWTPLHETLLSRFADVAHGDVESRAANVPVMLQGFSQPAVTMNEIIDQYNGCVIEFIGDAILAVFGAPHYIANHAEQAVQCGIEMRRRLSELNEEWRQSGWHASGRIVASRRSASAWVFTPGRSLPAIWAARRE